MSKDFGKKIFFTIFTALTVSGFIIICTLGQTVHKERVESKSAAAVTEPAVHLYTVCEHDGKITVFRQGRAEPYMVVDFDMSLLSDYDRQQIGNGLLFDTEAELRTYLQDIST